MILDEWLGDKCSREIMKLEALERMRQLNIRKEIKDAFGMSEKLVCSNYERVTEVPPLILKEIRAWEERYGNLAYHVVYSELFGCKIYNALSVSAYREDWSYERALIGDSCSMAYTINQTIPDYSESGSIQLLNHDGILLRIN